MHLWATAVKRPALVGVPAKPAEPYGVAELPWAKQKLAFVYQDNLIMTRTGKNKDGGWQLLKYFTEPARSTLYAKVGREGSDKDGKINFDQAGRLAGNWFVVVRS